MHNQVGKQQPKNMIQSYAEFESIEDGSINDKHMKKEIKKKIYTDPDYRKQLLLRVLPKFDKLDQFDKIQLDMEKGNPDGTGQIKKSAAAHLMRQINQSLGKNENSTQINEPKTVSTVTPKQSIAQEESLADSPDQGMDSSDIGEQLETNTVVENECDNDFHYMIDTPKTPNSLNLAPKLSQS